MVYNNLLKNNPGKCHLLISSNENLTVKISEYEIQNSDCEELLGVKLDCDDHFSNSCKKARGELNALVKIASFIGLSKRLILMNACFTSQFSYGLLIWTCHSHTNNRKINRPHERYSRFFTVIKSYSFQNYSTINRRFCFYSHEEHSATGY